MNKTILSAFSIAALVFLSCTDDVITDDVITIKAPETYTFERRGTSSVNFSGQSTRIKMAEEIINAFKVKTSSKEKIDNMFAHQEDANDFSKAELNASSKNVRSEIAASEDFDKFIKGQVVEVFPNWETNATEGTPGKIEELKERKARYVNAKGLEYDQAFAKGLIGALMVDQMLNNYLSTAKLDEGTNRVDNDTDKLMEGKNYTTMEHKWDEAYGYLYGAESNPAKPVLGADSFLNKYVKKVDNDDDFSGIADEIYNAFKLGRAAIVAKNYELRDKQVEIIREKISRIIAVRAVHYLQSGKIALSSDKAAGFHDLSEGYGFIYSLRFTQNAFTKTPHLPVAEIKAFLATLQEGSGFWTVSNDVLDRISTRIASVYGFTVAQTL